MPAGKNRYSGKQAPELIFERYTVDVFGRVSNHESIGSFEVRDGFAERTGRQHTTVSERTAAVKQNYIQVALERKVLEAVIEHEHIDASAREGRAAGSRPVPAHPHPGRRQTSGYHHWFISEDIREFGRAAG
jgi:hypothetical protein